MKFFLFAFMIQLVSISAFAEKFTTKVYEIEVGTNGDPHLVKLMNGKVAFIEAKQVQTLRSLEAKQNSNELIEFELDDHHRIISLQALQEFKASRPTSFENEKFTYDPSVLASLEDAKAIFSRMRRNYQNESQCYNRAHIWTYEENKRSGTQFMKLFLFFTNRYIRRYNYNWWFHVTPMSMVGGTDSSNWVTLDRRYTSGPLSIHTWSNIFVYSHEICPIIYKYSSYNNNQYTQDCYLIPTPQYFWQPYDINNYELTGRQKSQYFNSEINHAYLEAF